MVRIIRLLKLYGRKIFRRRHKDKFHKIVVEWTGERWIYPANYSEETLTFKPLSELEISKIRTKLNEICAKP